ncbi:MAG: FtsW/RodA/SpoVE family cell cycle protein [Oscillospiraceae bacterium]|nr:FtsW/RodA/SpoVE family cell cycle protein [Oscillospiraceae bacterium]
MKQILKSVKNFIKETDKILLFLCLVTSLFGSTMVLSATLHTAAEGVRFTRDFKVMIAAVCVGLIAAVIISAIDYEFIMKIWPIIAAVSIGLMLLLFVPGVGVGPAERPDAKTWISLAGGRIFFQPSEIVKIGFIITFGVHLQKVKGNINHILTLIPLALHALIPIVLVVKSGDMGSALVFMIITIVMLFVAGLHWLYFVAGGVLVLAALPLAWIFLLENIQKSRFLALIYPELYPDVIYQQERGLAAIGGGGLTGQGLFKGNFTQLGIVPESQNDMVFSVVGEELGFVGCVIALLLLTLIVIRIARTGKHDKVGNTKVMCYGVVAMIAGQVIINIGMCLQLLPVIGITLPFFSAGGSSNLCLYLAIGLILSFYRYNQQRDIIDIGFANIDNPFKDN